MSPRLPDLELRVEIDGVLERVPIVGSPFRIGRGRECNLRLPDYSVSRRHALIRPEGGGWLIEDQGSTNGIQVNGHAVPFALIESGDVVQIGVFLLQVEPTDASVATRPSEPIDGSTPTPPGPTERVQTIPRPEEGGFQEPSTSEDLALAHATIVRSLSSWSADYGLDEGESSATRKRQALDEAYGSQVFGFLTRLARLLITAEAVDDVLVRVLEIAFEALPVDRGFILLCDEPGAPLKCALMRSGDKVTYRPQEAVPVSTTMLEAVMRERVALLTYDALSDDRLAAQASVRMHQIRAAMCAPLWSGERIIGVIQVDSPRSTGSFTEQDVDLLTALANYCAVAVERLENARRVEDERQARSRLARYHSPAVVDAVLREGREGADEGIRTLRPAEVSVLFADFVGFSTFAENASPEDVAKVMSTFFTHAVEAIFSTGGTLDKFIGDCVMAFFGAPMAQPDHALRAVEAAVRIQKALGRWNEERRDAGLPEVATRIGINSGPVVVGDIGSDRRVDYTVLGNTVNVAARLEESVAKPGQIVIGGDTHRRLEDAVPAEALGEVQLKGLSRGIGAYRVLTETHE